MTAPHADEVLELADGRHLAWAEWGDPRGSPLVFFHPWPGSRLLCPDAAATAQAGVRLITVDRPGYGRSDPVADPSLAGFVHDLERLLDHLWVGEVPVVGWSAGGQYAAACAALLAERVSAVALVATPAPHHELRWLTPSFQEVAKLAATDPPRALAAAALLRAPLASTPDWSLIARLPPESKLELRTMCTEALRPGIGGLAADVVAGSRPWGFVASELPSRVALFYGKDDPVITPEHGRWWARALTGAALTVVPESGHLVPLVAWAEILEAVR